MFRSTTQTGQKGGGRDNSCHSPICLNTAEIQFAFPTHGQILRTFVARKAESCLHRQTGDWRLSLQCREEAFPAPILLSVWPYNLHSKRKYSCLWGCSRIRPARSEPLCPESRLA